MSIKTPLVYSLVNPNQIDRLRPGDYIDPQFLGLNPPSINLYLRGDGSWSSINADHITSGRIDGARGVIAGSLFQSFVIYNGINRVDGVWYGGTVDPINSTRLNYDGNLHVTKLDANLLKVVGNSDIGSLNSDTKVNANTVFRNYQVTTNSMVTDQILAAVPANTYGSATFTIQAKDITSGNFHTAIVLVVHNGSTAHSNEYGAIDVGGICGIFSVDLNGADFRLLVQPTSNNVTVFKVMATLILA